MNRLREVFLVKEIPVPTITLSFDQLNPEFVNYIERLMTDYKKREKEEKDEQI